MKRTKIYVSLSMVFFILLLLNMIFPAQSDDMGHYFFALTTDNFLTTYFTWNGRFGEVIWSGYLAKYAFSFWFDFINSLVGTFVIFAFFYLIFLRLPKNRVDFFVFIALCIMLINSNFAAIFLWGAGSLNYLWGIGLIICFLIPFRIFWEKVVKKEEGSKNWKFLHHILFILIFLPLAFIAGWSSEHIGVATLFVAFLSIVYAIYVKIKLPWWYYLGFLFFTFGWIVLFCSPGSAKRSMLFIEDGSFIPLMKFFHMSIVEKISLINEVYCRYYYRGFAIFSCFFVVFFGWKMKFSIKKIFICIAILPLLWIFAKHICGLIVFLLFGYLIWRLANKERKFYSLFVLYIVWLLVGTVLLQLRGNLPYRAHFGDGLILATMVLIMIKDFYVSNPKLQNKLRIGAISVLFISLFVCLGNWSYVRYNWKKVEESVYEQKMEGKTSVVVPKELFWSFCRKDWDDPHVNQSDWWVNQVYAKYFGVQSFDLR